MKTLFSILALSLSVGVLQGQNLRPLLDPVCGLPGVRILPAEGVAGDYRILASDGLEDGAGWETLAEMTVGSGGSEWLDLGAHRHGRRFFRVMQLPINPPLVVADNFRLIDQGGRSFELHRAGGSARAFVLVFADASSLPGAWTELKALRAEYEAKGVVFWVINSTDDFSTLQAQASTLGADLPILHDRAQSVARAYGCVSRLEAVAIRGDDMTPFYRGALSEVCDTVSPTVVRRYLAEALDSTLAEKPIAMSYARGGAGALEYRAAGGLNYATDIAPILLNRCVRCHRKGDIGSFEMASHAVLVEKAQNIRRDILTGDMPPWHADPHVSRFSNDFSLTPEETSKLLTWLDAGLPRGTGPDPLVDERPAPAVDWPLGEPDYKISLDEFVVPATGTVDYQYIAIKNPLPTNAWLRATVLKPGDRTVVHHALSFA